MENAKRIFHYLFDPAHGRSDHLIARWLFLRSLGLIYFSAFFALLFQIRGLIGSQGILPAAEYLQSLAGPTLLRLWFAPTLLWLNTSDRMLMAFCWIGLLASVILFLNVWPRAMLVACFVCFLSFVSAAQDFSGYQSDGMLQQGFYRSSSRLPSFCPDGAHAIRPFALQCFCSCGNGFASTSNRVSSNSQAAILPGATSPQCTSTTRMALFLPGSAGTSSICLTGSISQPRR